MNVFGKLSFFASLLVLLVVVSDAKEKVYKVGRAFPMRSLEYVKKRFKEINPTLAWDNLNYLEKMAAEYASCKYEQGLIEGYSLIPTNQSYIAFVEYEQLEGNTVTFVIKNLAPIVDKWVEKRRFNSQIENARKFACSVNPGCGYYEKRMGVSCVFSPSSEILEDEPEPTEAPNFNIEVPSSPEALPDEGYDLIKEFSRSGATRHEFLENLSLLETSCDMLVGDSWPFNTANKVIKDIGITIGGFFGRVQVRKNEQTMDAINRLLSDLHRANTPFSKNMKIGCSIIKDCPKQVGSERQLWVALSCVYHEQGKYCL